IDKDLAAALLAEQINADGLVILTDADAVYENWGTPQQRAIRHATPDELAPFAKADGSMGPKVTAVSGYVRSRGKPAWVGALSRIEETLAGGRGGRIFLLGWCFFLTSYASGRPPTFCIRGGAVCLKKKKKEK
ncbi:hypothetical protein Q2475_27130, partial [Escherichia coli]|nr:hypothetical protein [Escherichia coli]